MYLPLFLLVFLLGLCVGSFCNVLIYRIPRGEEFIRTPSHCMTCGHRLKWHELIPVFSWLIQRGKCRRCGAKLSVQYPVVELLNGMLWLLAAVLFRDDPLTVGLYCVLASMLLVLSVIDWREFIIPNGINLVIFLLGVIRLVTDLENWPLHLIGMVSVSVVFLLLHLLTGGKGMGMGDVKLVAAAGLLLGWPKMLLALIVGSLSGAVIHSMRIRRGAEHKLAFGPYLAAGIYLAAVVGAPLIDAYLRLFAL